MRTANLEALIKLKLEGVRIERVKNSQGYGTNGSARWIVRNPTTGQAAWAYYSPSQAYNNLGDIANYIIHP